MSFSVSEHPRSTAGALRHSRRAARVFGLAAVLFIPLLPLSAQVDRLRSHVLWLTDAGLAGRRSGGEGAARAATYIQDQFRQIGFDVRMQEFGNNRRNVVARLGSTGRHVLIGAHYDGQAGLPSASDNAAGVAVLLELARRLKDFPPPVSVVMIAFDDEEQGYVGSRYYVDNPIFPLEETVAAAVFDTMGRSFIDLKDATLFVLGTENSAELAGVVERQNRQRMLVAGTDLIGARSDYAPFAARRIPYLFFTHGTHKDYHGPGDRPELLDYATLEQDATRIQRIILDIANLKTKPLYLAQPVYPPGEIGTLLEIITRIRAEKKDLPPAYRLVFEDMESRIRSDNSRQTLMVAASAMLGYATPGFSPFLLDLIVAPFYEKQKKPEIVRAVQEESVRQQK